MGLIADTIFLLINQWGNQIRAPASRNHLIKTVRKIDPEFRFHHMRYTAAWRAYEQTQDIYAAQRLLRHSSPVETVRYLKVQKEQMLLHQREQMEVIYGNVSI
ncbi:MAG: tyrosine-type recombinase/integrase [Candidatus Heimdallarchaeaceae archaeon]